MRGNVDTSRNLFIPTSNCLQLLEIHGQNTQRIPRFLGKCTERSVSTHLPLVPEETSTWSPGFWVHTTAQPSATLGSAVERQWDLAPVCKVVELSRQDSDLEASQGPRMVKAKRLPAPPVGDSLQHLEHCWGDRRRAATQRTACKYLKKLNLHLWS